MDLKGFKDDIIEGKVIFNDLDETQFNEFYTEFEKLNDGDKEFYLVEIIDFEQEKNLMEKNYLTLFEKDGISDILRDSL
jgi:hypothetical protein